MKHIFSRFRSPINAIQGNELKYCAMAGLDALALLMCTGTVIQTYLKTIGVDDLSIGLYASAANLVQGAVYLLFAGHADQVKRLRRAMTLTTLPQILLPLALIPFLFSAGAPAQMVFTVAMIAMAVQNLFIGLRTLFLFKFLYVLVPPERFARLFSYEGVVTGVLGALGSVALVWALDAWGFTAGMLAVFTMSALCFVIGSILTARCTILYPDSAPAPEQAGALKQLGRLLNSPSFRRLAPAHALRGLSSGTIGFMAVLGISHASLTQTQASYLVVAATTATILGSAMYNWLHKKLRPEAIALWGNLLSAASVLLLLPLGQASVFIGCYFAAYLGMFWVNNAVPLLVYDVVPPELMGAYTAGRSMITMLGMAASSAALGALSGVVHPQLMMVVAALCFAATGLLYFWQTGVLRKIAPVHLQDEQGGSSNEHN